jgi:hypothetical protein
MKVKSITARLLSSKRGKTKFEDELCSSSTHTVNLDTEKTKSESSSGSDSRRCRPLNVCVDESHNVVHEVDAVMSQDECQARWYSEEEIGQLKEANNYTSKMVCRLSSSSDPYSSALTAAYQQACSGGKVNEDQLREQVQQWVARTGLEQRCAKGASQGKQQRRDALLSLAYNLPHQHSHLSAAQIQELLAQEWQAITQPAVRFAVALAQAQV